MKHYKSFFLAFCSCFYLFVFQMNNVAAFEFKDSIPSFNIVADTIPINVNGYLTRALKYRNCYYLLYAQKIKKQYGRGSQLCLYRLSDGRFGRIVDFPNDLNYCHLDFFVQNDSIIIKPYLDRQSYYFDTQNYTLKPIDYTDDIIFEDENYIIYSLDLGEWGGITYFVSKQQNHSRGIQYDNIITIDEFGHRTIRSDAGVHHEYFVPYFFRLVNKINNSYFLTNFRRICRIDHPTQLTLCLPQDYYEKNKNGLPDIIFSNPSTKNVETVFENTETSFLCLYSDECKFKNVSSFVFREQLYHVYKSNNNYYITYLKDGAMQIIKQLPMDIRFFSEYDFYRRKNENNANPLLMFNANQDNLSGIMDIVDTTITMHYFLNQAV